jgi:hypothetical protein
LEVLTDGGGSGGSPRPIHGPRSRRAPIALLAVWGACVAALLCAEAWKAGLRRATPLNVDGRARVESSGARTLRFAVLGDSGAGSGRFQRMLGRIRDGQPDFVAHVGDIAYRGEWDFYHFRWLVRGGPTFLVAPGDHDSKNPARRAMFERLIGPRAFHVDLPAARLVFVDTAGDRLPPGTAAALARRIDEAGGRRTVIFLHVPPIDPRGGTHCLRPGAELDELRAVLRARRDRIVALFSGHVHGAYRTTVEGVPLFVSGGGGKDVEPGEPFHFLRVRLPEGGALEVEQVNDPDALALADRMRTAGYYALTLWLRHGWLILAAVTAAVLYRALRSLRRAAAPVSQAIGTDS